MISISASQHSERTDDVPPDFSALLWGIALNLVYQRRGSRCGTASAWERVASLDALVGQLEKNAPTDVFEDMRRQHRWRICSH